MALSDNDGVIPYSTDGDATEQVMITPIMAVKGGPGGFLFQPIHEGLTLAALINGNFGVASGTTLDNASNHDWEYIRGAIWNGHPGCLLFNDRRENNHEYSTGLEWGIEYKAGAGQWAGPPNPARFNIPTGRCESSQVLRRLGKKTGQLGYEDDATAVGKFVHEHQDFVVLIAAGNDADKETHGESQIGDNGVAKNCITVGATGSTRSNDSFKFKPGSPKQLTPTDTAHFSSRGRTKCSKNCKCENVVGHIKPDVYKWRFGDSKDEDWFFMSGTSMAVPLVAGCVALMRETLQKNEKHHPRAALIKALLVNRAINHSRPNGPGSDYEQGFGLVDVDTSIDMIEKGTFVDGGNKSGKSRWYAPLLSNIRKENGE
ncbi:hypothetical protein CEP53_011012 [Fusarium sp. AF-6]|nr:hypothetical protein CEP53_011012 [Fusarium sp. AF-6]